MHTSVYILHRQKIIVSAAELAVRPSAYPSLLETFIFGLESAKKVQVLNYSIGINRNVLARLPCLALPCSPGGYIPDPTLA